MCGRYSIALEQEQIEDRFNAKFSEPFKPRYNAAPSQKLPIILNDDPQKLVFTYWGLKPSWLSKISKRDGLINVRLETLRDKHTFRKDLEERRCLIPADGFYEWKATPGSKKTPFRIMRNDAKLFAFAGLWEENEEGGKREPHFAIITTQANDFMQPIHNRMPVILDDVEETIWLSKQPTFSNLLEILKSPPSKELRSYEVSRDVNRASEDRPELHKPIN